MFQFTKALGDEALDNVSLLAALQPVDIKEAVEAFHCSDCACQTEDDLQLLE